MLWPSRPAQARHRTHDNKNQSSFPGRTIHCAFSIIQIVILSRTMRTWSALTPDINNVSIPSSWRYKSNELCGPHKPLILSYSHIQYHPSKSFPLLQIIHAKTHAPILMNPHICPRLLPLLILRLQRPIQIRILRAAHEQRSEPAWDLRAEPATAVLHEPAREAWRERGDLVWC